MDFLSWGLEEESVYLVKKHLGFISLLPLSDQKQSVVHGGCGLKYRHVKQLNMCVLDK